MKYFLKTYLIFFLASLFFLFTQSARAETVTLNYDNLIDYSIISDNAIIWAEFGKIVQDEEYELKDKRLPNARFYSDNKIKIYSSNAFIKDIITDEWFEVEYATTTEDLFYNELEKQIPVENLFEKLISFYEFNAVHALDTSIYSNAIDGKIERDDTGTTWSAVRDNATGESVVTANASQPCNLYWNSSTDRIYFQRCYLTFDTSVITEDYEVTGGSIFLTYGTSYDNENDANSFHVLVSADKNTDLGLVVGDYDGCGTEELSERIDQTDYSQRNEAVLISTSTINRTGYTNFCWREGHDLLDDPIDARNIDVGAMVLMSETTGTDNDPVLYIEYSLPVEEAATTTIEHEFYDIDNLDIYDISIITSKSEAYTNASGTLITFTYFYSPLIQYLLIFSIACLSLYTVSIFYQIRRSTKKWG